METKISSNPQSTIYNLNQALQVFAEHKAEGTLGAKYAGLAQKLASSKARR